MFSVSLLALVLLPILVAGFALIGSMLRRALSYLLRSPSTPPSDWPGALCRLVEDAAIGLALTPILYLLATLTNLSLTSAFAFGLLGLAGAFFLIRLVFEPRRFGVPFQNPKATGKWVALAMGVGFLLVLLDRLIPYSSYQVYSGNDIRMFTLITQLVEGQGHFVSSWGSFAGPSWNVVTDSHLTFSGSEAVFSLLNAWVPWNTPQLVSAAVIVVGILIPCSAFVFLRSLFPHRSYSVPFFGALTFGVAAAYPLFFQDWGGIDEQVAWFLFPVALALLLNYLRSPTGNSLQLTLGGILLGGTIIVNPFPIVYVGLFFLAFLLAALLSRTASLRELESIGAFLAIALVIASPVIYKALAGWHAFSSSVPAGYAGWNAFRTAVILKPGDWFGSLWRFLTLTLDYVWVAFVVVIGCAGLVAHLSRERQAITLTLWLMGLMLLNTNGPFGLYFVQYPGWSLLYPDRLVELMFLPLSAGVGLAFAVLFDRLRQDFKPLPRLRRRGARAAQGLKPSVLLAVLFVALLAVCGVSSYHIADANYSTVGWGNSFTGQDAATFEWMEQHLPSNSTVLVNPADSGSWVPEFTGIRVFPYFELINNVSVYDEAIRIPSYFNTTQYADTLTFLHDFNISYVYFGQRTAYSVPQNLTLPEFLYPTPVLDYATQYSSCVPSPNPSVLLLTCNNDTATFTGPVVLSLTEWHNGQATGTAWFGVPSMGRLDFVLHANTPQWPGEWEAEFSEVPLATQVFQDSNAVVLQFNPLFLSLATNSTKVLFQSVTGTVPQV